MVSDLPPVCVAFEGGGALGLAHLGAWQMLARHFRIVGTSGTSAGSIVAALCAAGYDPAHAIDLFRDLNWLAYVKRQHWWRLLLRQDGWSDGEPFYQWMLTLLAKRLPGQPQHVSFRLLYETTGIYLAVIACDLNNSDDPVVLFDVEHEPETSVAFAVRASISIPGFFVPVPHRARRQMLVDGGLLLNLPLEPLRPLADSRQCPLIGVRFTERVPYLDVPKVQRVLPRSLSVMLTSGSRPPRDIIQAANYIDIEVDVTGFESLNFKLTQQEKDRLLRLGAEAAERALDKYLLRRSKSTESPGTSGSIQQPEIARPEIPSTSSALQTHDTPEVYQQLPLDSPVAQLEISKIERQEESSHLPATWMLLDQHYIDMQRAELNREHVLRFFDGSLPQWREALAVRQIPRRSVVHRLREELETNRQKGGVHITVLKGPGGEGKSTALRQVICDLVTTSQHWRVLWHNDTDASVPVDSILTSSRSSVTWLIASDDAETIVESIFSLVKQLHLANRQDVHFLLASRDTDWIAAGVSEFEWRRYGVTLNEVLINGLSPDDAREIVTAWSVYDEEGLGKLSGLSLDKATQRLYRVAISESNIPGGSFLGAMLRVRIGIENYEQHVQKLLTRLKDRRAPGRARTLRRAFAYIAVLHARDIPILTREVLAASFNCDLSTLQEEVIEPLGNEAAVTTTGRYVLTRHRAIAETAVTLLTRSVDFYEILDRLVGSARHVFLTSKHAGSITVPDIARWNYLSSEFFKGGEHELGIRLAQKLVDVEPTNAHFIVTLGRLLREAKQTAQSVQVFRESDAKVDRDRAFYYEWGTSEGNAGNHELSAWLSGLSLSDGFTDKEDNLNNKRMKISLAGLCIAFEYLFDKHQLAVFSQACGAAALLGLRLELDRRTRDILEQGLRTSKQLGVSEVEPHIAFERLQKGIVAAWRKRKREEEPEVLPHWVVPADALTFDTLAHELLS